MDTLTLPGTIPGLLRRGSPVVCVTAWDIGRRYARESLSAVVLDAEATRPRLSDYGHQDRESIALDLESATGRAHAAWWLLTEGTGPIRLLPFDVSLDEWRDVMDKAKTGGEMTDWQITMLRAVVLHVAGVL